jgi:hypothetical protein
MLFLDVAVSICAEEDSADPYESPFCDRAFNRSRTISVPVLYVCHMTRHNDRILPVAHGFTEHTGHFSLVYIFRIAKSFYGFQYLHYITYKRAKLRSSHHQINFGIVLVFIAGKIKKS